MIICFHDACKTNKSTIIWNKKTTTGQHIPPRHTKSDLKKKQISHRSLTRTRLWWCNGSLKFIFMNISHFYPPCWRVEVSQSFGCIGLWPFCRWFDWYQRWAYLNLFFNKKGVGNFELEKRRLSLSRLWTEVLLSVVIISDLGSKYIF